MEFETDYQGPWLDINEQNKMVVDVSKWRYQRPVTNAAKCCSCGTCYIFCPTGCIDERGGSFEADLAFCKGCGICARVCPVTAVAMVLEGNKYD